MNTELSYILAVFVSEPWNGGWLVWKKLHYRARAVVCFDRCLVAAANARGEK